MDERVMSRHEHVFTYIQDFITKNGLKPGTKLAGERKLAQDLSVSRETVRQGLKLAEDAGIIVRMATLGTFVAPPRVNQELGEMSAFNSTLRQLSLDPAYESVSVARVTLNTDQAWKLNVEPGAQALRITAIGVANELPLAYYESLLPEHVFQNLPVLPPWSTEATYQIAARAIDADELTAHQEFEAIAIPNPIAEILKVPVGTPGFRSFTIFSAPDKPVELRTAHYPGSRYRFKISRHVRF